MMKNILILGASGMLGSTLLNSLSKISMFMEQFAQTLANLILNLS